MRKKQSVVSQSSAEAEVKSLDAGFRIEGLSAQQLWERNVEGLSKPASTRNNISFGTLRSQIDVRNHENFMMFRKKQYVFCCTVRL